jgi:arabinose-5-phosphate isomerase
MLMGPKFFQDYIDHTIKSISSIRYSASLYDAANAIADCKGVVITTGMGKAGHIAQKMASSLCSLGMPACYLHPGEASHGDVGLISNNSILVVFSTSGKTREVIETVNSAKHLNVKKVIAITSHPDSTIRRQANIVVDIGQIKEAGRLELAPTTSIVIMLVVADLITLMASEVIGTTAEQFALRHHSGYLGEKARKASKNGKNTKRIVRV